MEKLAISVRGGKNFSNRYQMFVVLVVRVVIFDLLDFNELL